MHRYKVTYSTDYGNVVTITVFAMDPDDAVLQARHEYSDISGDIIMVNKEI